MSICNCCFLSRYYLLFILLSALGGFSGCQSLSDDPAVSLTAAGKPEEGPLETFKGQPFFDIKEVFNGEGQIYLLFEGGPEHHYSAMQIARFNLSWIMEGELTGDGELPLSM